MSIVASPGITKDRIAGTWITIWDVYLYLEDGWALEEIAETLRISVEQVRDAVEYINRNRDYVADGHRQIEERNARGNPPEIEARLVQTRARMRAWLEERRRSQFAGTTTSQDAANSNCAGVDDV